MKTAFVILRTLGDVILLNTLVNEYKKIYPDDIISVYVNEEYLEIVTFNPNIKEVICPPDWDFVLKEISDGRYDKVFVPYQTTPEDNAWHQVDKYRHQHLVDFYAKRCGFKITEKKCYMYPSEADYKFIEGFIKEKKEDVNKMIAVHTTTLVPSKNWDKFSELAKVLYDKGYVIIQVGLNSDKAIDVPFLYDFRNIEINKTAVLLSKCKAFIGLDSGISYIADAMGCKTICLMGATIPETSGPIGPNTKFIVAKTRPECQEIRCHGNCHFNDKCINNITVEDVLNVLE